MTPKIVTTRDGSQSLFSDRFQQHYHNISGALTESRNVFFDNTGLTRALSEHRNFTLVEVGFGTGLHVALLECMRKRTGSRSQVHYYSVEKYPLTGDIVRRMNFDHVCAGMGVVVGKLAEMLYTARKGQRAKVTLHPSDVTGDDSNRSAGVTDPAHSNMASATAAAPCDATGLLVSGKHPDTETEPFTRVEVFRGDFHEWDLTGIQNPTDFILHDAFSPNANPDLWSVPVFKKLLAAAAQKAVLGTYCSASKARAAMVLAGWHVARIPGPPGKREVTIASPDDSVLAGCKRVNESSLADRFRKELEVTD